MVQESEMRIEGERIVAEGKRRGLHLRLLGAVAFQIHCPKYSYLTAKLGRVLSDIDFAAYGKERSKINEMLRQLGYTEDPEIAAYFANRRMIWNDRSRGFHVDIFFDKLEMNHDVLFADRLEHEGSTLPLADMLLEKMQIVHINNKDVVDTIMLLREHVVGSGDSETIDANYVAGILSSDWGFYHTVTTNLKNIIEKSMTYPELTEEDRNDISQKIRTLLDIVEAEPKKLGWKLRARLGTSNKWYRDVEEVER